MEDALLAVANQQAYEERRVVSAGAEEVPFGPHGVDQRISGGRAFFQVLLPGAVEVDARLTHMGGEVMTMGLERWPYEGGLPQQDQVSCAERGCEIVQRFTTQQEGDWIFVVTSHIDSQVRFRLTRAEEETL